MQTEDLIVFLTAFIFIFALLYAYIGVRLSAALAHSSRRLRAVVWLYLVISWLTSPLPIMFVLTGINEHWADIASWFAYLNMGFNSFILLWFASIDVIKSVNWVMARWIRPLLVARPAAEVSEERRGFMAKAASLSAVGFSGSMTGVGFEHAIGGAVVKEVSVPLGSVSQPLKELKIVQFTDLHIGALIKRDYVQDVVDRVNQLKPDIIALTGDLVDGSVPYLAEDIAPLAELESRYGNFFVTGNHEYYSGAPAWIEKMAELGFKTLINEHQIIEHMGARMLLAGVTDYRAHRHIPEHQSSPAKAMAGAPAFDVSVLLAHQPKSIDAAADAGFDLQISGHTHGGQYYPWNFMAQLANPYVEGLHKHKDKTWIYVSPGTGFWGPPIRLGTRPEITVIRLA